MATFVLVHGAWHGAWCWYRLSPALRHFGHRVIAPDLPGRRDGLSAGAIDLHRMVERICAVLARAREPVTLVGHSLAGLFISQAAEEMPAAVSSLVYIAAFLPADGDSVVSLSQEDPDSAVTANSVLSTDQTAVALRPDCLRDLFYADCDDSDVALARRLLVPEPVAPFAGTAHVSPARAGRIRRAYIRTARDAAITPARQDAMLKRVPCAPVITMETGHCPFLADPAGLARHLDALSRNPRSV